MVVNGRRCIRGEWCVIDFTGLHYSTITRPLRYRCMVNRTRIVLVRVLFIILAQHRCLTFSFVLCCSESGHDRIRMLSKHGQFDQLLVPSNILRGWTINPWGAHSVGTRVSPLWSESTPGKLLQSGGGPWMWSARHCAAFGVCDRPLHIGDSIVTRRVPCLIGSFLVFYSSRPDWFIAP